MRASHFASLIFVVGLVGCSGGSTAPSSVVAPADERAASADGRALAYFDGTVDAQRGVMSVVVRSPAGAIRTESTLPYGTGAGQAYFHTCGAASFDGALLTLSGNVQAVNSMGFPIGSLNAVIDSVSLTGVTLGSGPGAGSPSGIIATYGNVPANTATCASSLLWKFNDPSSGNFTFQGHVDGTAALVGAAGGWLFDEGAGATSSDFVGTNPATLSATSWASGASCHAGACLAFNDSTSRVTVPYGAALQFGTGDFTSSAWFKTTAGAGENIVVGPNRCGVGESWITSVVNHKAAFATFGTGSSNGYISSAASVDDGAWHNLVGRRSGTTLTLFVDGAIAATTTISSTFNSNSGGSVMTIGNLFGCGAREFGGSIDSVRLFSRALSDGEVASL